MNTQQTTKHTPLPLTTYLGDGVHYINHSNCAKRECTVAKVYGPNAKERAEFIVRACNSHYELMDLVREALESQDFPNSPFSKRLRAALTAAQGKEN